MNTLATLENNLLSRIFYIFSLFFVLTLPVHSAPPTNGLVAYWNFDETSGNTASDSTNSNLDASLEGNATWTAGKFSNALTLNEGGYVTTVNDTVFSGTSFTASAWVYVPNSYTGGWVAIMEHDRWGAGHWGLFLRNDGKLHVRIRSRTTDSPNPIGLNNWHHIAASYDRDTNTLKLYLDGTEVASMNNLVDLGSKNNDLNIGANQNGNEKWKGSIDEVRYYNRALSDAEVGQLMSPPASVGENTTNRRLACEPEFYHSIANELYTLNKETGEYILVGESANRYNAMGWNEPNGLLYAIDVDTKDLLEIDNTGVARPLGVPTHVTTGANLPKSPNAGFIDNSGHLWVTKNSNFKQKWHHYEIYKIDIASNTYETIAFQYNGFDKIKSAIADYVYIESTGAYWGLSQKGFLYKFDLDTLTVTKATVTGLPENENLGYGAAFTFADNEIYVTANTHGGVYKISNYNTNNPIATFVTGSAVTNRNDGASCPSAAAPFDSNDYGDAPTSGASPNGNGVNAYGEAMHSIVNDIYLGSTPPDADLNNQGSDFADGDDGNGTDDEDGINIPQLSSGQEATIVATVAGDGGYLQAWIDWNGDGTFGVNEQIASNLQDNSASDTNNEQGTISFTIDVPESAITEQTFARFRWSTTLNLDTSTAASDGEVEDYAITVGSSGCSATTTEVIPEGSPSAFLTSDQVSWNITGSFQNGPIRLNSFTVNGEPRPFSDIIMPDTVNYQFEHPNAANQYVLNQGQREANIGNDPTVFKEAIKHANASRDLSHYLSLDGQIAGTDFTEFLYSNPITSAGNRYILISERNGNNRMSVEALDANGDVIGNTVEIIPGLTGINTDITIDYGQKVYFTVYPLTAIAPRTTKIYGIRLTQIGSATNASSYVGDAGDGKVFIMVDPVTMNEPCGCSAGSEFIPPGSPTDALTADQLSWDISGSFGNGPLTLNSFTVAGEPSPFSELILPDTAGYRYENPDHRTVIRKQGTTIATIQDAPSVFLEALRQANSSRDLSHYLQADNQVMPTDYTEFFYNTPIKSAGNRYILISERYGNNEMAVEALDANGNVMGNRANVIPGQTHVNTHVAVDYHQDVHFTVFPLTAIAPRGADIHGIRLTQTGSGHSKYVRKGDGGDGKVFIMVDPQTMPNCNDYGDAPTTDTNYGEASHIVKEGIYLGASLPDTEASNQESVNADADDNNGSDDEDGVSIPQLTQGQSATFSVTVAGVGGYLQAWIDWNGDGDFIDDNEQIATNIQDNGDADSDDTAGVIGFNVNVPNSASTEKTYARFRWATTANLDSNSVASNGEVEDYSLTILESDQSCSLDDAASGSYSTASVTSNAYSLSSETRLYQATFNGANWEGQLRSFDLKTTDNDGGVKTQKWNAAEINRSNRNLFTYNAKKSGYKGIELEWDNLNHDQKSALTDGDETELGEKRLTWLQGSDTDEGAGGLRERTKILGDIIHSNISFKGPITNYGYKQLPNTEGSSYATFLRSKKDSETTIFIGANDGMLHAIKEEDGSELFAYVPNGILSKIATISDPNYGCKTSGCLPHEYLVDGVSSLGDAYFDNEWHTILLGTLGLGGKGLYALDVTEADGFSQSDVLWEIGANQSSDNESSSDDNESSSDDNEANISVANTLPGNNVVINFSGTPGGATDWIGIYAVGASNQSYSYWLYTNGTKSAGSGTSSGSVSFDNIPEGNWEARFLPNNAYTSIASASFSVADNTGYADHMGYSIPKPSVVRLANNTWAALTGNGYGGASHQAVLFIIDVKTGNIIKSINTGVGTEDAPNGLSTPTPVDSNGDMIADIIYAGDLQGNVWAFDVSNSNPDNWRVRDGTSDSPSPFFRACADNDCNTPQIITAPPQVGRGTAGGLMVYIGTGKYTDLSDNFYEGATAPIQSFYGLYDQGSSITSRSDLQEQSILAEISISDDLKSRVTSNTAVNYANHHGWYMDFLKPPSDTHEGERVISQALLREGRLIFTTMIPPQNSCSIGGKSWLMELDAVTGKRLSVIPFDTNDDKQFTDSDNVEYNDNSTIISGLQQPSLGVIFTTPTIISHSARTEGKYVTGSAGTIGMFRESASQFAARMSWKQLH